MILDLNLHAVREAAKQASTEELLDAVTVYRAGQEAEAVELQEAELRRRDVTDDQVRQHAEEWGRDALLEAPGLAYRCSFCTRPATTRDWRWHLVWGLLPLFPRQVYLCRNHANPKHKSQ